MKFIPVAMNLNVALQRTPWKMERGIEEVDGKRIHCWMISNSQDVPLAWLVSETDTPIEHQTATMILLIPQIFTALGSILMFASDAGRCPFCSATDVRQMHGGCILKQVHDIMMAAGCLVDQRPEADGVDDDKELLH